MMTFNRDSFYLRERIVGATRNSIILKGDNGEKIFCHLKIFNKIIQDPSIRFFVQDLPEHKGSMGRVYQASKWICAFIPTRIGGFSM